MHNFRKLQIWQIGIELNKDVYTLVKSFPTSDKYILTSQILRSTISIPSNIAEGSGRKSEKEFKQYLSIAIGSSYELETQLIIAETYGYITPEELQIILDKLIELQKKIVKFKNQLTVPKVIIR